MASVFLVREYDYELQEVRCVASEAQYAQMFIEDVRTAPCVHPDGFHTDDWPVSDCAEQTIASADRLLIEEWTTGTTEPVRVCCPRPHCTFTASAQVATAGDPIWQHIHQAHSDVNSEA